MRRCNQLISEQLNHCSVNNIVEGRRKKKKKVASFHTGFECITRTIILQIPAYYKIKIIPIMFYSDTERLSLPSNQNWGTDRIKNEQREEKARGIILPEA